VKTVVDISKWTVLKFKTLKDNIDKTHKQLNKACRQEEEMLSQNVSQLILTSSRKKYISENDELRSLSGEAPAQKSWPLPKL